MKERNNPILQGVRSKIRQLLEQFSETEVIQHNGTKGSLREAYLKDFIVNFVPPRFGASSGFITDCKTGEISPQIDILIYDRDRMPHFGMSSFVTISPIETAVMAIEVKSSLKSEHFAQIKMQQESVRRMYFTMSTANREYLMTVDCTGISAVVFALDTSCSDDKLLGWFKDISGLEMVCVIGKCVIIREPSTSAPRLLKADGNNCEVLHFLSWFSRELQDYAPVSKSIIVGENTVMLEPDIGPYFSYDVPPSD